MENKQIPKGIRNNNPLNIRYSKKNNWKGRTKEKKDAEFEEFIGMNWGYRAAFLILYKYMTVYRLRTVFQLCARWAPLNDNNDTMSYVRFVCNRLGCSQNDELSFIDVERMASLAAAMTEIECGVEADKRQILYGYSLAAGYLGFYKAVLEAQELRDKLSEMK